MNSIQFIDLKAQAEKIGPDIKRAMDRVFAHGKFIMGPEVYLLEKQLAEFIGAAYAVSCSSGTDGLLLSLMALGIGRGDAVFTTPFTFAATAEAISITGAEPVFVDVQPDTFNMDPRKLEGTIGKIEKEGRLNPRAVIPVDIFGLPADYVSINAIAQKYHLPVIEDGAQSFGAKWNGKFACNLTRIGVTSFFPAKPLGCYGDGGAVFTSDEALRDRLISLRVHGQGEDKYENIRLGINGRLDTLQAAILLEKIKIFNWEMEQRRSLAGCYRKSLAERVVCQHIPDGYESAWAQFSFVSDRRDAIIEKLKGKSIPTAIYYPNPLHLQKAFSFLGYAKGAFPVSEALSRTILSVPFHPYLSLETAETISHIILSVL